MRNEEDDTLEFGDVEDESIEIPPMRDMDREGWYESYYQTARFFINQATGKCFVSFKGTAAISLEDKKTVRRLRERGILGGKPSEVEYLVKNELLPKALSRGISQVPFVRVGVCDKGRLLYHIGGDKYVVLEQEGSIHMTELNEYFFVEPEGYLDAVVPNVDGKVGSLKKLRGILTLENGVYYPLLAAGMSIFQPDGARAVFYLTGPAGAGKRTCAEILAALVDPCTPLSHPLPDTAERLYDLAEAHAMLVLIVPPSKEIPGAVERAILNVSDGYRGEKPRFTEVKQGKIGPRTIILCGERNVISSPLLLARTIEVPLPPMTESRRQSDGWLSRQFHRKAGKLMMGVLKLARAGISNYEPCRQSKHALTNFFQFIKAYQAALTKKGRILKYVERAMVKAEATPLSLEPFAKHFVAAYSKTEYERVQAGKILEKINENATQEDVDDPRWPKTPQALGVKLKRIAADLRDAGIIVEALPRTKNKRELIIRSARI